MKHPMTIVKDFRTKVFNMLEEYDNKPLNLLIAGGSVLYCLEHPQVLNLNTKQWNIYFCDERITTNPEDLNYVQAALFHSNTSAKMHILCEENKQEYIDVYKKIDLCFMGIGNDGHIASIFPNSSILDSENLLEQINNSPKPPPHRITVTIKFLNGIKKIFFLLPMVGGKKKSISKPHSSILERLKTEYEVFYQG
ncbi:6-Phosphogluconolactonase [Spraguea lophii 42_110]|uniref:6-Phosphogluconolactonase n=1 Tax=Spraguea lophii (strain 42_110) TaxID=1358809 RepID=S7W594_SPRLO|nr:6-Phosphogluconolactonase [Spraguea lophii 42_110]